MKKIRLYIAMSDMDLFASTRDEIHDQAVCCDMCDYVSLCSAFEGNDRLELIVLDDSWFEVKDVRESEKNDDTIFD